MNLYEIEESLRFLIEAREDISPDQLAELEKDTARALKRSCEKRDNVGRYIKHLESQDLLAKAEEDRIGASRKQIQSAIARLKTYTLSVMDALEVKKLEGNVFTLKSVKNADKVEILDQSELPEVHQNVSIGTTLIVWNKILSHLTPEECEELQQSLRDFTVTPRLEGIRAALKSGPVPGAKMSPNGSHLEVK